MFVLRTSRWSNGFVAAVTAGRVQGLMDMLAPDVVLLADGGGIAQAVRVPVVGVRKVVNLLRPSRWYRSIP